MSCSRLKPTHVTINDRQLTLETADTPEKLRAGFMFRNNIPDNHGMVFVHDREDVHSFWMKNTPLPLDMIFINNRKEIVGLVERASPYSLDTYSVPRPSCYVIETNAGWVQKNKVQVGQNVQFHVTSL